MCAARAVTVIPATAGRFAPLTAGVAIKKRVAAYARVSTDNDEQLSSYEAQVSYYTRHIQSNPTWTFVEVYTDEGISATSTKKREGFNRMIADAWAVKLILSLPSLCPGLLEILLIHSPPSVSLKIRPLRSISRKKISIPWTARVSC